MNSARSRNAFTLLELLVAVTITLVLAAVMLAVTTGTLNLWRRAQDGSTMAAQAKLTLDLLERDLQAGFHRKDGVGTVWLAADVINNPASLTNHGWQTATRMKPAGVASQRLAPVATAGPATDITGARFGLSGVWLRLIAASIDSDGSVPIAISYQLVRRPVSGTNVTASNPAEVRYTLFRSAVATADTFAAGNSVTAASYASSSATSSSARAAATLTNPYTTGDTLAANVVDFGVWFHVRDNAGALRRIYPADNSDLSHAATDAPALGDSNRYPEVADVMVRILTAEGARIIDAIEKSNGLIARPGDYPDDAAWWWSTVEANSRVFTRRIEMKGGAL